MVVIYGAQMAGALASYIMGVGRATIVTLAQTKAMGFAAISAGILRKALALLGGPIGIIALVASSLLMFSSNSEAATDTVEKLTVANYDLAQSFKDLSQIQAAAHIVDIERAMGSLKNELYDAQEALNSFESGWFQGRMEEMFNFDTSGLSYSDVIVKAKAEIEQMETEFAALADRMDKLKPVASGGLNQDGLDENSNIQALMEKKAKDNTT